MANPLRAGYRTNKAKRRSQSLELIDRNSQSFNSARGFGTGKGKPKGAKTGYGHRVRILLAKVQASLADGMPEQEVMCRLAAVALVDPSVFSDALKLAPRRSDAMKEFKPAYLIRAAVLIEPTIEEVAEHKGVPANVIEVVKQHKPQYYDKLAFEIIAMRLTSGEMALLAALRYSDVFKAAQRLAGDAVNRDWK